MNLIFHLTLSKPSRGLSPCQTSEVQGWDLTLPYNYISCRIALQLYFFISWECVQVVPPLCGCHDATQGQLRQGQLREGQLRVPTGRWRGSPHCLSARGCGRGCMSLVVVPLAIP